MRRDETTLLNIAEAGRLVVSFVLGLSKESFLGDFKTQSAVLYRLIVMGEAVKRLSTEFRTQHAEISWSLIAGMRDHLIHGYDIVDHKRQAPPPLFRTSAVTYHPPPFR